MGRRKSRNRKKKNKMKIAAALASSSPPPPPPPPPPWIDLPADVTANILQRLGAEEILESAQKVCTTWRRVCQDPAMWRVIDLKNPDHEHEKFFVLCRNAVDRGQGQLVDLTLHYFGDDELLNYVADRSSHLRRLTLDSCYEISGQGLAEAVRKLPHLEELHLNIMPSVEVEDVETIGISCPMLKSFTFNERGCKIPHPEYYEDDEFMEGFDCNGYALAIGKTMPNLHHLRLFAQDMKNKGLQAILDGCPHLESLDLRQCFGLDLSGDLGKRCSKQIRDLKCPSDSISDIWWLAGEPSHEWDPGRSFDSESSDFYPFGCFADYDYEDYEYYDDYTSPLGIGFFGFEVSLGSDDDFF